MAYDQQLANCLKEIEVLRGQRDRLRDAIGDALGVCDEGESDERLEAIKERLAEIAKEGKKPHPLASEGWEGLEPDIP